MNQNSCNIPSSSKKRIEFIDLAKGVCILSVILMHCGVADGNFMNLRSLRMPMYFLLSGMFFKDYGGFIATAIKKINKLIIPFVFFFLLGFAIFWLSSVGFGWEFNEELPGILKDMPSPNYPIWFLRCLFIDNLIFYCICRATPNIWVRFIACWILGAVGYVMWANDLCIPMNFMMALYSMPFFGLGYVLYQRRVFTSDESRLWKWRWMLIPAVPLLMILSFYVEIPVIRFLENDFIGPVLPAYCISAVMVTGTLLLLKMIRWLPFVSYCGKYSLILLGVHQPVKGVIFSCMDLMRHSGMLHGLTRDAHNCILFFSVLVVSVALIPLLLRLVPHFVAQKDLIKPNTFSLPKLKFNFKQS